MARSLNNHIPTAVDFLETTATEIDNGSLKGVLIAIAAGDLAEAGFTFNETQETTVGLDNADNLTYETPEGDNATRWFRVKAEVVDVDNGGLGVVGEEGVDMVDFVLMVNNNVVATSNEGAQDAADTISFTLDTYIPLDDGNVVNFALHGVSSKNEEFDVVVEAADAQVFIV